MNTNRLGNVGVAIIAVILLYPGLMGLLGVAMSGARLGAFPLVPQLSPILVSVLLLVFRRRICRRLMGEEHEPLVEFTELHDLARASLGVLGVIVIASVVHQASHEPASARAIYSINGWPWPRTKGSTSGSLTLLLAALILLTGGGRLAESWARRQRGLSDDPQ